MNKLVVKQKIHILKNFLGSFPKKLRKNPETERFTCSSEIVITNKYREEHCEKRKKIKF